MSMSNEPDDSELLRRWAAQRDEGAFGELVRRHVDLVYGCALRRLAGDAHLAKDVTQLVFCDLARRAGGLADRAVLGGWLHTSTRFAAAKAVRGEQRRRAREEIAFAMKANDDTAMDWERLRPVLDEAIDELGEQDREAVVLRFFEGRSFAEIGARLHLTENTARMRVERALEKLHARLGRRGIGSTAVALGVALAGNAAMAAPAGLAGAVTTSAMASGASVGIVATFMSMTKLQMGLAAAAVAAGATGMAVQANTLAELRQEVSGLRQETVEITALEKKNELLGRMAAEVADLRRDEIALAKLETEAGELRTRLQAVARADAAKVASAAPAAVTELARPSRDKLDRQPRPIHQTRPLYPAEMRQQMVRGEVVLAFVVDTTGAVTQLRVVSSSEAAFEGPALEAVSQWKYAPATKGGVVVPTAMQMPIIFTVVDDGQGAQPATAKKSDSKALQLEPIEVRP